LFSYIYYTLILVDVYLKHDNKYIVLKDQNVT